MEPENLPSRPTFHWDLRKTPWTDKKGPQDQYYQAVKLWKQFHNKFLDGNSNKIPQALQGLTLQSQLFGRALDLFKKVSPEDIESEYRALRVASAIHKHDVLSVVTDVISLVRAAIHGAGL